MHFDANYTQKEVTDVLTHSIKPSGPSANFDRNNDGGCQGRSY
jgi:hypothetical protein